jgi:RimJ/RimL family protein N-acetyltransferase
MSADWFAAPPLRTGRLRLDALRLADAPAFLAALGSPEERDEVVAHLRVPRVFDVAGAGAVIAAALTDPDRIAYAQRLADGTFVGTTSFYEIAPAVRALAIGHTWVARPWWRTFVNTESKLAMLTRAFDGLGAERVVWHTDIRNVRSQRAIERLGAHREGVLRHHRIRRDGSWRDTVQFSMLQDEWPAVRDRLTAALEREDDDG